MLLITIRSSSIKSFPFLQFVFLFRLVPENLLELINYKQKIFVLMEPKFTRYYRQPVLAGVDDQRAEPGHLVFGELAILSNPVRPQGA